MIANKMAVMALVASSLAGADAFGACRVDDADFASAGGGCKDLETGLVFSPDLRAVHNFSPNQDGLSGPAQNVQWRCDTLLNQISYGGFSDWRAPTLGEFQTALANGLNAHLDYFLNGAGSGDYYWTSCDKRVKGALNTYAIRHSDGNVRLSFVSTGNWIICVRGLPADPKNDCPSAGKKSNHLAQTTTGALLLLPLAVVLAASRLRPRRP
jgi:hypothetical protein